MMNRTPLKSKHRCECCAAKHRLKNTAATALFSLLLPLMVVGGGGKLLAQSVQVETLSADYTNHKVTFSISWAADTRDNKHLSKVWVFVDYASAISGTSLGAWQRANITAPTTTAGTISGLTGQGFFLQGTTDAFSATVTVTLSNVPAKFSWCAFATDYPPTAVLNNGTYTLSGTPPFIINGSIIHSAFTYSGGMITSLTDETDCPGVASPAGSVDWTTCGGFSYISNVSYEGHSYMNWNNANTLCANKGMRLPSQMELSCICLSRSSLPGGYVSDKYYWSSTANGSYYYVVDFDSSCRVISTNPNTNSYVKCVI